MSFKTLVLNADYKPLSYFPLSICNWKESIKAVFLEKVSVISEYNEIVRSPSIQIKYQALLPLKNMLYVQENRLLHVSMYFLEMSLNASIVVQKII